MEVTRSRKGIFISQTKYTLDLLKEIGKLGSIPTELPWSKSRSTTSLWMIHLLKRAGIKAL